MSAAGGGGWAAACNTAKPVGRARAAPLCLSPSSGRSHFSNRERSCDCKRSFSGRAKTSDECHKSSCLHTLPNNCSTAELLYSCDLSTNLPVRRSTYLYKVAPSDLRQHTSLRPKRLSRAPRDSMADVLKHQVLPYLNNCLATMYTTACTYQDLCL